MSDSQKREARNEGKTLHCLRHSYALKTWSESGDINLTRELLGHTTLSTTMIYTKFPPEYLREILGE
ncbi:MAG: tyrosine-type recombinase/integrase [Candidatus Marinimicrobia bacterium]|nr:tyrosine-type recombinase/integrase [Candidatus Neomarinimicrobiota bacterium]